MHRGETSAKCVVAVRVLIYGCSADAADNYAFVIFHPRLLRAKTDLKSNLRGIRARFGPFLRG